jgi:hypothetical protein
MSWGGDETRSVLRLRRGRVRAETTERASTRPAHLGDKLAPMPRWSVCWDKKYGLWRVAEDDPDSDLYAESSDADAVIGYIMAHA